jgi:arylsulfatase A-like enzyme
MRSSARRAGLLALLLLSCSACGAERARDDEPRLVLLVATCTLNKRFLAPYDPAVCWTPNLAALARMGLVFERHETESGQSGCSFASIFTGTQADRHGIYHHPTRLAPESTTIAEAFSAAGWDTYFWWGHPMASPELEYGQGVHPSERYPFSGRPPLSLTAGDPPAEALFNRLALNPGARAFVQLNFTVTHAPYPMGRDPRSRAWLARSCPGAVPELPPGEFEELIGIYLAHLRELQWDFEATVAELGLGPERVEKLARAIELAYTASVQQLDVYLGALLENLARRGLLERTLIAFTADHGEALHREGLEFHWTHGMELAPEVLGVPWILCGPGIAAGRWAGVTRSIDVFPTLAGLAGVPVPPGAVDGVDLSAAVRGEREPPELVAFSHTTTLIPSLAEESRGWSHFHRFFPRTDPELLWVRARAGDRVHKLRNLDGTRWGFQVFDLARDPWEARDLADEHDPEQAEMRRALEAYKRRLVEGFERAGIEERADVDAMQRLRGLGYAK